MKVDIHKKITRDVLRAELSPSLLELVLRANEESDDLSNQSKTFQHFDDNDLRGGRNFIQRLTKKSVDHLSLYFSAPLPEKEGHLIVALYALGRLLHAVQDFYSHSNWINLIGSSPWTEALPVRNLKTGYFSFLVEGWKIASDWVNCRLGTGSCRHALARNPNFYRRYLDDGKMYHWEMNKDEEGTLADLAFRYHQQRSGFLKAVEMAKLHSQRKWAAIKAALADTIGINQARTVFNGLKSYPLAGDISRALRHGRKKVGRLKPE